MKLSILIPVYNEADNIREVLKRVMDVNIDKEIIVIDDGSTDGTYDIVKDIKFYNEDIIVICGFCNHGKGTAIRTALSVATGDVVIIQDADLEYDPQDYVKLLRQYIGQPVYGVRDLTKQRFIMRWGNRFITWITNLLFDSNLSDVETCYKLISRKTLESLDLQSNGFEIEAEITAKLLLEGCYIYEVPIRYDPRYKNKKLSVWDGIPTLWTLMKSAKGKELKGSNCLRKKRKDVW